MQLNHKITLQLNHKLAITQKIMMKFKLLQSNQFELLEMIRHEVADNPVLDEETPESAENQQNEPEYDDSGEQYINEGQPAENQPENLAVAAEKVDWEPYLELRDTTRNGRSGTNFEDPPDWDYNLSKPSTLVDHLLWQLQLDPSFSTTELSIGETIIYNLNENGFLESSIAELSYQLTCTPKEVESVLVRIQHFDPVGVAARSLKECLLCQMNNHGIDNELIRKIIEHHLNHLKNKNYSEIARQLKVSEDKIHAAIKTILTLNPKPGIRFQPEPKHEIIPEVFVYKRDGKFIVSLDNEYLPKLSVNRRYQAIAKHPGSGNNTTQAYLTEKIKEARWFIEGIKKRQITLFKVVSNIVDLQQDFFNRGPHFLRPLKLEDIAKNVKLHLSTISRATRGKYVQTPHGVFELKYFFSGGIAHKENHIATTSVKHKMLEYIKQENPAAPLTDKEIVDLLAKDHNIKTVPRTIGKYRKGLGIPNSRQRKNIL